MRKPTLAIDAREVAPQVIRVARLPFLSIVASKSHAGVIISSDGAAIVEIAIAALVGQVALSDVDTLEKEYLAF
jgi:hypothetical protein